MNVGVSGYLQLRFRRSYPDQVRSPYNRQAPSNKSRHLFREIDFLLTKSKERVPLTWSIVSIISHELAIYSLDSPKTLKSGRVDRPNYSISEDVLLHLRSSRFTWTKMAPCLTMDSAAYCSRKWNSKTLLQDVSWQIWLVILWYLGIIAQSALGLNELEFDQAFFLVGKSSSLDSRIQKLVQTGCCIKA